MFRNYLVTTFRNLVRNKVNTFINVAGLAISIACGIVVYVFVKHENTFDNFHQKADRIYRVVSDDRGTEVGHMGYVNFALANALRSDLSNLETVTQVYVNNTAIVQVPSTAGSRKLFEEKEMTYADPYFLKTFDYAILAGQKDKLLTNPDEVVLTRQLADKFYGKEFQANYDQLIGKTLVINKNSYRISAILSDVPRNTNLTFRLLLPFQAFLKENPKLVNNWKDTYSESYAFVTLPQGQSPEAINAALVPFKNKYLEGEAAKRQTYQLQALADVHTDETYGGTLYATPGILIIAFVSMGIIVLITACINFINLATAQSLKRAKEIGIRKALGSRYWQLIVQFMSETFLLIVLASVIAIGLAQQFINAFNQYLSFIVDMGLEMDTTIVYFLIALAVFITVVAGYYPARVMASYQPIQALKSSFAGKNIGFRSWFSMRKVLVVTQFTVSQLLIMGTIVVAMQMRYFRTRDLGYTKEGIITVEMPENDLQKLALFRNQLLRQSQIEDVTFSSGPPTSGSNGYSEFRRKSAGTSENTAIERKFVDPHYLSTYNIKLLAGRDLRDADRIHLKDSANKYNVLLNQKAIRVLGYKNAQEALGQTMVVHQDEATIIGVVDDFFNVPLQRELDPCLLFYATNWVSTASIRINQQQAGNPLAFIQKSWESIYTEHIYKAQGLDEYSKNEAFYIMEDIMYQAFKIFAALSIFIGCLGLYGLVSFLAIQRQKEIGIRKVLGASVSGIVYLFSKEFVWLVVLAFVLAAPLGYMAMSSWLETFALRIPLNAGYFAGAFVLSLLIAGITVSFQAIKAALANPVKSLRTE